LARGEIKNPAVLAFTRSCEMGIFNCFESVEISICDS